MRSIIEIERDLAERPETQLLRVAWDSVTFRYRYVSDRGTRTLLVTARVLEGWDHVSVSCQPDGLPSWRQLEAARRLVAAPEEWMMQLHVPPVHADLGRDRALHLWRPHGQDIPLPPAAFVA